MYSTAGILEEFYGLCKNLKVVSTGKSSKIYEWSGSAAV